MMGGLTRTHQDIVHMMTCLFFDSMISCYHAVGTYYHVFGGYVSVLISSNLFSTILMAYTWHRLKLFLAHIFLYHSICNWKTHTGFCLVRILLNTSSPQILNILVFFHGKIR